MEPRHFELLAPDGTRLGGGDVSLDVSSELFAGEIDLRNAPDDLRAVFDEFEEVVDGQILSLVDEVQAKVAALSLRVAFDSEAPRAVDDLQIFPSEGGVSFRLAEPSSNPRSSSNRSVGALAASSQE